MTNAEKFTEVFGTELYRKYSTRSWWDQEFVPNKSEIPTGWIPVSERLPEDHKDVLICLSSDQIYIGCYNSHRLPFSNNVIGWGASYVHNWCSNDVIAWMPLPEPYKASPTKAERSE